MGAAISLDFDTKQAYPLEAQRSAPAQPLLLRDFVLLTRAPSALYRKGFSMVSTLTPAFGRDYKSKRAVLEDFEANKLFIIADVFHPDSGRTCSRSDLQKDAQRTVNIRYNRLTRIAVVTV